MILSGDIDAAVASALVEGPRKSFESLDYHSMTDDADPYLDFARAFFNQSSSLARVEIAEWILGHSAAEFSYLEVEAEAARIVSQAVKGALDYLALTLDQLDTVAFGPDAGLTREQVAEYNLVAKKLRDIEIPTPN